MSHLHGTIIDGDLDDLFSLNNNNLKIKPSEDGTMPLQYETPFVSPSEYASLSSHGGYNKRTPFYSEEYVKAKDAWKPTGYAKEYDTYINRSAYTNSKEGSCSLLFNLIVLIIIAYLVYYIVKKSK